MIHIIKQTGVLLLLIGSFSSTFSQQQQLNVMTYNIRYDNPDDGMFSWDHRKDMIYWLFAKYDPDILGIQEALYCQMKELDSVLNDYHWSGVGRDDGISKGEFVPVFYKKDKFMLKDEGHFWLSEHPGHVGSMGWDAACTRMVSWVKLQEASSDIEYYVFNTHFDHVGDEARLKSAKLLADSIRSIAGNNPVIITGDLNCLPASEPVQILAKQYHDARVIAQGEGPPMGTTFVGFPADLFHDKLIDYIFISSHFKLIEYEICTDNANGFFPSDHLAVFVSLEKK